MARPCQACLTATLTVLIGVLTPRVYPVQPAQQQQRQLALLITVPDDGKYSEAAWNDQLAMYRALRARGFQPGQILSLSGPLQRKQVLDFLRAASAQVAKWQDGTVFLYYSGSGYWPKKDLPMEKIKTGLHLGENDEENVLWDEVFAALDLPKGVRLLLLPDC